MSSHCTSNFSIMAPNLSGFKEIYSKDKRYTSKGLPNLSSSPRLQWAPVTADSFSARLEQWLSGIEKFDTSEEGRQLYQLMNDVHDGVVSSCQLCIHSEDAGKDRRRKSKTKGKGNFPDIKLRRHTEKQAQKDSHEPCCGNIIQLINSVDNVDYVVHDGKMYLIFLAFAMEVNKSSLTDGTLQLKPCGPLLEIPTRIRKKARPMPLSWKVSHASWCNHYRTRAMAREEAWEVVRNEALQAAARVQIQSAWVNDVMDKLTVAAFRNLLDGVQSQKCRNGLLDGGNHNKEYNRRTLTAGIDCRMQQFADFRTIRCPVSGKVYILWLQFAREAKLREGTYIYAAFGPLYKVSREDWEAAPRLGPEYGIEDEVPSESQMQNDSFGYSEHHAEPRPGHESELMPSTWSCAVEEPICAH